jgi:hypothetical protein
VVDIEIGMEKQFFVVTPDMVEPLSGIGITVTDHVLYLTVTSRGAIRIVPVRQANADGEQNEYARTKEIGLVQAMEQWVRLYTDQEKQLLQSLCCACQSIWRSAVARPETGESLPPRVPRQRPADRQS